MGHCGCVVYAVSPTYPAGLVTTEAVLLSPLLMPEWWNAWQGMLGVVSHSHWADQQHGTHSELLAAPTSDYI